MQNNPDSHLAFFAERTEDLVYRLRISPDGTPEVLYISRSVRSILGYDPAEFYQNPSLLFSLLPPEERGLFLTIDGGEVECVWPLSLIRKDGNIRFIETKNVIHRDPVSGYFIVEGIGRDRTEERQKESDLRSRDRILEATSYMASELLTGKEWLDRIKGAIGRLGGAANASRAYLYQMNSGSPRLSAHLVAEWAADGVKAGSPPYLDEKDFEGSVEAIFSGMTIGGPLGALGPFGLTALRASPDLRSILIVPIAVQGMVSAVIGFDECRYDRVWSSSEVLALETAARIIGAAMEGEAHRHALMQSESRFQRLFQQAPLGMVIADHDLRITDLNPAFLTMTGYTAPDLIGRTFRDITHPDDLPGNEAGIQELTRGVLDHYRIQKRYIRKDGGEIWTQTDVAPFRVKGGLGYIAMIEDVTLRRQAEERLSESEEMHRSFLQHFQGIVYRSIEGEPVFLHGAVLEITGYTPEEIKTGNPLWESLIHPADLAHIRSRYAALYATPGDRFDEDYRIIIRDGRVRWVHEMLQHRIGGDGRLMIEAAIYDITDRHRMEEELSRSNEKLNLLQSVTRHDILNQVMMISAYTSLLSDSITDTECSRYCAEMERAIDRIRDIAGFTYDYQSVGLNGPVWQDLDAVVRRAFMIRDPESVALEMDPGGYGIYADPLLEKVFYNLIDNSRKHGGEGISRIMITCIEDDGDLCILCEDDGAGFDPTLIPSLFLNGKREGSGLGLLLIREILSITGISIEALPSQMGGAGFRIRVPHDRWRKEIYITPPAS
ncbi:hypothetical protein RJ53_05370 [Methanocalculus chunghsingensis]|uniref:histidine kinase n=2 Tax=Methanocalculus chunghsingensis TaxID=156457 RepID=A0A8J7W7J0_9EURY|nr:hypothetical protein [Methanocalculus chunghsingensis]